DLDSDGTYDAASGTTRYAAGSFYQVDRLTDVFGNFVDIAYDTTKLFATSATAHVLVDTTTYDLATTAEIDYRALAPKKVTDPNDNFVEAAFDKLGRLLKTAVESKGT